MRDWEDWKTSVSVDSRQGHMNNEVFIVLDPNAVGDRLTDLEGRFSRRDQWLGRQTSSAQIVANLSARVAQQATTRSF